MSKKATKRRDKDKVIEDVLAGKPALKEATDRQDNSTKVSNITVKSGAPFK